MSISENYLHGEEGGACPNEVRGVIRAQQPRASERDAIFSGAVPHFLGNDETLVTNFQQMELWHGIVVATVSLFLQAGLLLAITHLLTRHIAYQSERILKETRLQAQWPRSAHHYPPAAKETKEIWTGQDTPGPAPCFKRDSRISSDSLDIVPPTCQDTKGVNYTQVVFSANGGQKKDPAWDYEDIKEATDYVNVNPQGHKPSFWTVLKPAVSDPVEYTKVAM
ncbi:regulator of hemoglobinization and erythroid cell expansion protein [Perognathus longimembris pacificus]|uniref:regulator of hemoglobinization and erythroid cell expansion protein n=1 Tax=Perognathus longimembris pacificus TaxID=214514 RepID=UPI002018F210|nr:regulator of hemoglobinization and erythroid cell expansion protein [Perognathus longimembris pacificus]